MAVLAVQMRREGELSDEEVIEQLSKIKPTAQA